MGPLETWASSDGECCHELLGHWNSLSCFQISWLTCSGIDLMRNPKYNKGMAFTKTERDRHYLHGLLPPAYMNQDLQVGLKPGLRNHPPIVIGFWKSELSPCRLRLNGCTCKACFSFISEVHLCAFWLVGLCFLDAHLNLCSRWFE